MQQEIILTSHKDGDSGWTADVELPEYVASTLSQWLSEREATYRSDIARLTADLAGAQTALAEERAKLTELQASLLVVQRYIPTSIPPPVPAPGFWSRFFSRQPKSKGARP